MERKAIDMSERALTALAVYRTHKCCNCECCTYAREYLAACDAKTWPRSLRAGAEK